MTGIRQSIVFQIEDKYGEGNPSRINDEGIAVNYWVAAPPGSFFTSTHRRNVSRIQGMGSKFWDTVAYGSLQGTWEWSFYLDYNYPEPLFLVFEGGENTNVTARNILEFTKNNNKRIPSFTVRRKLLNDFIGGADNEVSILKGCVVKSATFTKPSNASYIQVSLSGFYANEELTTLTEEQMDETDFTEYEGNLVEYGCLTSAELSEADTDNSSLIQNTDHVVISIDNSAEQIFSTCAPFSTEYAEGLSNITLSASSYANHPLYYKRGVYSGGKDFNNIVDVLAGGEPVAPGSKGMRPLDSAYLTSYDAMARYTNGIIGRAYGQSLSSRSSEMHLEDVVMNNLTWQKGDGGKLMDSVSNCPVRRLTIKLTTPATQPFAEGADPDSWQDLFYSVSERKPDGTKYRVNNVFVEAPETIVDRYGIIYTLDKNKGYATVHMAPDGLTGDVELLNEISRDGLRYPVIAIDRRAFDNSADSRRSIQITSIHIPPNIRTIGVSAFLNVNTLQTVTGGTSLVDGTIDPTKGVTRIETTAFRDCTSLSSCSLLESTDEEPVPLEYLGAGAFMNCALTEVVLPSTLVTLARSNQSTAASSAVHGTFASNAGITKVTLPINLSYVSKKGNVYYDASFYGCDSIREFHFIQSGTDDIADYTPDEGVSTDDDPQLCPCRRTPWYRAVSLEASRAAADPSYEKQDVVVTWEGIKDVPRYMFYLSQADVTAGMAYVMRPADMDGIETIGAYAFARSGLDVQSEEDGIRVVRLEDVSVIEERAFINPLNVQKLVISSPSLTLLPQDMWYYTSGNSTLAEIDLGGCTGKVTAASTAFTRVGGLVRLTIPPNLKRWSKEAIVFRASSPRNPMFRVPGRTGEWVKVRYADGNVEDLDLLKAPDGVTPRRFVRNDLVTPDAEDSVYRYMDEYGTYGNLLALAWGDLEEYTWGELSDKPMFEIQIESGMVVTSVNPFVPGGRTLASEPLGDDEEDDGGLTLRR